MPAADLAALVAAGRKVFLPVVHVGINGLQEALNNVEIALRGAGADGASSAASVGRSAVLTRAHPPFTPAAAAMRGPSATRWIRSRGMASRSHSAAKWRAASAECSSTRLCGRAWAQSSRPNGSGHGKGSLA